MKGIRLKMNRQQVEFWAMVLLLYITVVLYQGYQYGQGDQSQILPCLYAQDHQGAYAQDHYVHAYLQAGVNERTVFHFLFRYLGYSFPWVVLGWHALLSCTLFAAWLRISALGIRSQTFQYVSALLIFIIGYHTSAGGNELYYNSFIPSLAAKALASWAFYFWLKEDFPKWVILLLIAGFLQPLVGLQLFLLTCISLVAHWLMKKKGKELPWKWIGLYLLITLPWLYLLQSQNGAVTSPETFMDIVEFRLAHHFFPSSFGWLNLLVVGVLGLSAFLFYKERLKWLVGLVMIGGVIYWIGVEKYRVPIILYTQWFKTTIWLEALACIMIAIGLEKLTFWPKAIFKYSALVSVVFLVLIGVYRLSGWFGGKPDYIFPWNATTNDAIDVSLKAAERTPEDAVFIVPVDFTAFRWYAKRSLYVDYKAMLHQEAFLKDWYDRIGRIYAYGLKEKQGGFDIRVFSKELFDHPTLISIDFWKSQGITHIISSSREITSMQKIYENKSYTIYKLP
jgi:hypothetical protein